MQIFVPKFTRSFLLLLMNTPGENPWELSIHRMVNPTELLRFIFIQG